MAFRKVTPCCFCIMGCIAVIIPLVISLSLLVSSGVSKFENTGILAIVIFRHGERAPTEKYPTDPYDERFWLDGWGTLTNVGKTNAYNFGQWLRERYSNFLPDLYSNKDIYVTSTDVDRTLMSAQLCLAGLYPPKRSQIWNTQLLWQPIPVHTVPRNTDQIIVVSACAKYRQELEEVKRLFGSNQTVLYEYLTTHTGMIVKNDVDVETLYNILEMEENAGLKLPGWTKTVYPQNMRNIAVQAQRLFTKTENMKRLKGGPLIKQIITHIQDKISNQSTKKLHIYSGHDMTLVAVLEALGVDYYFKPDPLDALLFELHKTDENQHHIEILYLNHTEKTRVQKLRIYPESGLTTPPISLANFITATKPVVPNDWEDECKIKS